MTQSEKAFARLIERMGRREVQKLLRDWNSSQLSEDGTKILKTTRNGSTRTASKAAFFRWLFSDEQDNPDKYSQDEERVERIKLARLNAVT